MWLLLALVASTVREASLLDDGAAGLVPVVFGFFPALWASQPAEVVETGRLLDRRAGGSIDEVGRLHIEADSLIVRSPVPVVCCWLVDGVGVWL